MLHLSSTRPDAVRASVLIVSFTLLAAASSAFAQSSPFGSYPVWTQESNQEATSQDTVAFAGDVNGDGHDDVLVGAGQYANTAFGEGRAQLFLGTGSAGVGVAATPAWTAYGGATGINFGRSLASAGDVNNDGFLDVVIGGLGRASVYYGSASGLKTTPVWTVVAPQPGGQFGRAVASAGDVNGDGRDDVVIGEPYYPNGIPGKGRVLVYHGTANGLSVVYFFAQEGALPYSEFAGAVSSAGDVNGDGFDDNLVGSRTHSNLQSEEGAAFLYYGSSTGVKAQGSWSYESNQNGAHYGATVASAGDVNGDGFDDFIIGSPDYDGASADVGRADVFFGAHEGPPTQPSWTRVGTQAESHFGVVGPGADVDGDGYADVAIGSRQFDDFMLNEGRVDVFAGGSAGLGSTPAWSATGNQNSSLFGSSVALGGDVNGDGKGELLVGASLFDAGQTDEGRVFLFRGGQPALTQTAATVATYGTGKVGPNGPVVLSATGLPRLGWTTGVKVTGGTFFSPPLLFLGAAPANIPYQGGTFLVAPQLMVLLPFVDFFGTTGMTLDVPAAPALAGGSVYMQVMFPATGPYATSLSNGMVWSLGG